MDVEDWNKSQGEDYMAYDFESLLLEEKSVDNSQKVERKVLYGNDINQPIKMDITEVMNESKVNIVFENDYGKRFALDEDLMSKHLLMLGGIGSGKTNTFNFVIESLLKKITDEDIIFIFDTKGDFYRKFYQWNNPRHLLIGNSDEFINISGYWNIFDELSEKNGEYTKASELTAKEIAKQFFRGRESETQPFFTIAAADLVSKVICDFIRHEDNNNLNNQEFVSFINRATIKEYDEIISRNTDFESARLYYGDSEKAMTPQALGVFGNINAMINDLFVGVFAEKRNTQSFSMRRLVREKGAKVVFIEYDLSVGEVLGPIYRILIDLALKEALGRKNGSNGNVYLVIDEFKLLPDLMHIDDALNFGRSMGVKVFAGIQSISQLYDIYGEERGRVLAAGFMNSFCFQTWDYESRKYISNRFGENYTNLAFKIENDRKMIQREGYVVEDWDILNLDIGEAFVNLVGYSPFKFKFSDFSKPHKIL